MAPTTFNNLKASWMAKNSSPQLLHEMSYETPGQASDNTTTVHTQPRGLPAPETNSQLRYETELHVQNTATTQGQSALRQARPPHTNREHMSHVSLWEHPSRHELVLRDSLNEAQQLQSPKNTISVFEPILINKTSLLTENDPWSSTPTSCSTVCS